MPSFIEDNLYLGDLNDAANLKGSRNELKIKFVLTVGIFPMLDKSQNVFYRAIEVADLPSEDLLSHFESAYEFILASQRDGPVLVHCFHGVSRSATIVIAFLMKRHGLDVRSALERVQSARESISPNDGFMQQLTLYARMRTSLDLNFPAYKVYRLKKCARIVREVRLVPSSFGELIKADPGLTSNRPNPNVYKCRKCRRVLFNVEHTFKHRRGEKFTWKSSTDEDVFNNPPTDGVNNLSTDAVNNPPTDGVNNLSTDAVNNPPTDGVNNLSTDAVNNPSTDGVNNLSYDGDNDQPACTEKIFIEPLVWMKDVRTQPSGKLSCPRCSAKLGSYSWTDYCVCSCRSKIFPFFYVTPSKIDFDTVVKNVQVTV